MDKMDKKRFVIAVTIFITLLLIAVIGLGTVKITNAKKLNKSVQAGLNYLQEGQYEAAKIELSKVLLIQEDHEQALEMIALIEDYSKLQLLYINKEYKAVDEAITRIKENKYITYLQEKIDEIKTESDAKLKIINELGNIDVDINEMLSENEFDKATELINKYLSEDLKEDYLDKLNILGQRVKDSKDKYETERAKLEEQKRLEEKKKQEELEKLEQQLNQQNQGQQGTGSTDVNKNIGQLEAIDIALAVVQKNHPGYGPHYFERGLVAEGEKRWAFIFLKVENPNATNIDDTTIIGKVGYTVNVKTGEVKKEDWLVQD